MTAPNQPNPSGSATQGGLSEFAAKTAAQRKTEATAPMKNSLETNFFGSWISNLFGGFFNGVLGLISALVYGLKGITGGLIDLTGALKATDQKADTAVNTANGAAQTVVNVQKEIIQKIVAFDIRSPTPGYIAINGTEWPSIPRAMLIMQPSTDTASTALGNTGSTNLGQHRHGGANNASLTNFENLGSHVHTMGSHSHAVAMTRDPEASMTSAQQFYAFIRIPADTPLSGLNFYARGTPSDLRVRVYSMSPTGDLTAITPESPNLAGLLVAGRHTATPTNFDDTLVEAGTWVCVRFSVVGTVWLAGIDMFDPEPPAGFYPVKLGATSTAASGTASPDTIAETSLSWANGFVVYVAVGNNIVVTPVKRYLSDLYDRSDTSDARNGIGGQWSRQQTSMGLLNVSDGVKIYQNAIVWRGAGDGSAEHTHSTPLTTEKAYGRVHIGTPATTAWSRAFLRKSGTSGVAIGFRAGSITLDVRSGFNTYSTAITALRTLVAADEISWQVGTDADVNEIYVWHNGIEVIHTTGVVVPSGPGKRYCGVFQQRTPNNNSTAILDWETYDIPDVEPAS